MKIAQLKSFGNPPDVVSCIDAAAPDDPAGDEVIVEMRACPINPAELLLIQGRYASKPELPSKLGIEGAGRVVALGDKVKHVRVGDHVISLDRSNWAERCKLKAAQVVKLPEGIDLQQAAMLKVNPATALKMLDDYVDLRPGDWLIQNAANSAVGTCVIQLAKARGVKTVNVVRRESLRKPLRKLGADAVVVDGDDLVKRVKAEVGKGEIELAIDAVAGSASLRLADCLADGATMVNYGLLSGQPCQIGAEQTIFRGITLTGFWLAKVLRSMGLDEIQELYQGLAKKLIDGKLHIAVEATYPLTEIKQALSHAMRENRQGKILLTPT